MDASTHAMHALASSWLLATKHDPTLGGFLGIFRRGRMGEMVGQPRAWDSGRCKRRLFGFCKTSAGLQAPAPQPILSSRV